MADRFSPRLVNGAFEDPVLVIRFHYEGRAILFDLGRIDRLSVREMLKISDVFVSHTHIDHFIGFDQLLRCSLNRQEELRLFGPRGFVDNVRGKLAGYTWNLIRNYSLSLVVSELDNAHVRKVELKAAHDFRLEAEEITPWSGILLRGPAFCVRAAILDHRIPCLAFALEESSRLNVRTDVLRSLGVESGPWLGELKKSLRESRSLENRLEMPLRGGGKKELSLSEWRELLIVETRGQKIAYVVDNRYNEANAEQIVALAQNADLFYCESFFSRTDESLGQERCHLTAAQAGSLARRAEVRKFVPIHFSLRYQSEPDRLKEEALDAFAGKKDRKKNE
ncbi:MAG TPA: hypothetical protein VE131_05165 [Terriglobales bacterium]|nr:hypothetical protein [Terriglobales bacterium]